MALLRGTDQAGSWGLLGMASFLIIHLLFGRRIAIALHPPYSLLWLPIGLVGFIVAGSLGFERTALFLMGIGAGPVLGDMFSRIVQWVARRMSRARRVVLEEAAGDHE
jgi:hypothetical protein